MKVIEQIKQFGLEAIVKKYNLSAKKSTQHPELTCFCYDQLQTPKNEITNECRGLVLNTESLTPVSYPFYRFGDFDIKNHKLDFENGVFLEKIDGSMCSLYFYKDKWHISTKKTVHADGQIDPNYPKTISDYFFELFDVDTLTQLNKKYTYIFEFKFPSDFHYLVQSEQTTITLIGVRNMETLEELDINQFSNLFQIPHTFNFDNQTKLDEYVNNLNPIESEGLIYLSNKKDKNGSFIRYKIKSPQFEIISLLRVKKQNDEQKEKERIAQNSKWLEKICAINPHRDFLTIPKYKQFTDMVAQIDKKIKAEATKFKNLCEKYKDLTNPKEIAKLDIPQNVKTHLFLQLKCRP